MPLYRRGVLGIGDGGGVIIPPTGGSPITKADLSPQKGAARPTLSRTYRFSRPAPVFPPSDSPSLPPQVFVPRKDQIYDEVTNNPLPSPGIPAKSAYPVALSPTVPPGPAPGGGVPPQRQPAQACPPPNRWMYTAFNAAGQPCGWACHPRDTGGVLIPCKGGPQGGAAQSSSGSCVSVFVRPGIYALGCECDDSFDYMQAIDGLSRDLAALTALSMVDSAAVQEEINSARFYAGQNEAAALLAKHYKSGFLAFDYARKYDCCWPTKAQHWMDAGGVYVRAGGLCAAIVTSLYSLVELTYELRTDPAYNGPPPPQWPVAFPPADVNAVGPTPADLHSGLLVCNNLISNLLALARIYATQTARAVETIRQCQGGSTPSTSLVGYRLGDAQGSRSQPRSETEFVLYYLSRYPAIAYMIPANPGGASDIATRMDASINELIASIRQMKSDLIHMESLILDCGRGKRPPAGYVPPQIPVFPDPAPLDPSIDIPFLPNPYDVKDLVPGGSVPVITDPSGSGIEIIEDIGPGAAKAQNVGFLAFLAVAGAALVARG